MRMPVSISRYSLDLHNALTNTEVTLSNAIGSLPVDDGIAILRNLLLDFTGKLLIVGNGGSAAIASHIALDFWKRAKIPAQSFNDSVNLTALSNDLSYNEVFSQQIACFAQPQDILIAISSSGASTNILNTVTAAKLRSCQVVTFSGFSPENPLRQVGDFNFYTPSPEYGTTEIAHMTLLHCLADSLIEFSAKANASLSI